MEEDNNGHEVNTFVELEKMLDGLAEKTLVAANEYRKVYGETRVWKLEMERYEELLGILGKVRELIRMMSEGVE